MMTLLVAARAAVPATSPLLPDLNARLHPSDSTPWTILFALTLITLLPAILMCMTPLVRLMVVFHFLRQALGTQTAPSNPTLLGLGLMMTWFLMTPVLGQVDQLAVQPYRAGQITGWDAIDRGSQPVKHFLLRYAREKDLALFTAAGQIARPNAPDDLPMRVVVPAYILSEFKAGFAIGAVLFLPFLLVDMVTAAITTSIGMFQLPPVVVSTPLKILLFVMVDGWNLLAGSLLEKLLRERMTPDLVAELLRQLMKEAMILTAPVLVAAVSAGLRSHSCADPHQSAGAVPHCGAAPGRDGDHPARWHAVVSWPAGCLHPAADVGPSPLSGLNPAVI